MAERPPRHVPLPRADLDSDPPPRVEHARPVFVTRVEMERYVTHAVDQAMTRHFTPIAASLQRIEGEAVAARTERLLRAKWEEEQREKEELEERKERTRSENDLRDAQIAALQRPMTPLVVPIQVPKAPDSDPLIPKAIRGTRSKKLAVIVALIVVLTPIIVAAIGAYTSQHSSPHGATVAPAPHE